MNDQSDNRAIQERIQASFARQGLMVAFLTATLMAMEDRDGVKD